MEQKMIKKIAILAILLIICAFPLFSAESNTVTFRAPVSGGGDGVTVKLYRRYGSSPNYVWDDYGTLIYQGPNPQGNANYYELQRDAYLGTYKVTAEWSQAGEVYYDEVTQQFTVYQWFWTFPYLDVTSHNIINPTVPQSG